MNKLLGILFCLIIFKADAQVERINFFPDTNDIFTLGIEYQRLNISTLPSAVSTKEVNNYYNIFESSFAHRFTEYLFVGISGSLENASENAVRFGLPLRRRFTSNGFKEPSLFIRTRLRKQSDRYGNIDLFASVSPSGGSTEIGRNNSNTINGRDISKLELSHGIWEDEWEFRSSLKVTYFDDGVEKNSFYGKSYDLISYLEYEFNFTSQYSINPSLFVHGNIGVLYRGIQNINAEDGSDKRSIQAGTGSIFGIGVKKLLKKDLVLDLSFSFRRNDYFVKSTLGNLDGIEKLRVLSLDLIWGF